MSYPEARYFGVNGRVSATFRQADHPAEIEYASGGTCHYLATTASTGGEYGMYRWDFAAAPSGPVRLFNGKEWADAKPGDFLYVPAGGLHAFRNESGEPASMLLTFAPGAPREGYFEGLAEGVAEEQRAEFMRYHDTFWV
jgi:oxalate decarboxylase/phosphoglucose isomerase-like protein (cupin superfamily)